MVKHLPAMRETWAQTLGWEDALEKEMATQSSTLGLENSMDGGDWWATVHGVTKNPTQLSNFMESHSWASLVQFIKDSAY